MQTAALRQQFLHAQFSSMPAPQMTSNVYSQESYGEARTLRGPFWTSRYSTAGAAFMSAVARSSSTNDRQPKRAREPSGDSPGRVVVAFGPSAVGGRFTTFEQQLGARAS